MTKKLLTSYEFTLTALKEILFDTVMFAFEEDGGPLPEERVVNKAVNKTIVILRNGKLVAEETKSVLQKTKTGRSVKSVGG